MAYHEFTPMALQKQFGIEFEECANLFADTPPAPISALLRETLDYQISIATRLSTEKARSEFIIAPVLLEVRRQLLDKVSLFSGAEFNVDIDNGLRGVCDFLFSLSPLHLFIQAPVVAIVEAKNENIKAGITQCAAEMVAAQLFNQARNQTMTAIFGVVTTGTDWLFLRLEQKIVLVDGIAYNIEHVEKIVGIFVSMLREASRGQTVQEGKALYSVL